MHLKMSPLIASDNLDESWSWLIQPLSTALSLVRVSGCWVRVQEHSRLNLDLSLDFVLALSFCLFIVPIGPLSRSWVGPRGSLSCWRLPSTGLSLLLLPCCLEIGWRFVGCWDGGISAGSRLLPRHYCPSISYGELQRPLKQWFTYVRICVSLLKNPRSRVGLKAPHFSETPTHSILVHHF